MVYNQIKHILPQFRFRGEYVSSRELLSGNIHNTYLLTYREDGNENPYILQHVNTYVFRDPRGVMDNIAAITEHLKKAVILSGGDASRQVLELVRSQDGDVMHVTAEGEVWRVYDYISGALALDEVKNLGQMEEVGRAFGRFQRHLADFPAARLVESIPHFHQTTKRFYTFVRAVDENKAGRVRKTQKEIEFFFDRRRMMGEIVRLLEDGTLPLRVTHNDTKSNNVLLDEQTGKALCVIDLDTVMPGSSLYDYGDGVRFAASAAKEDEEDTGLVHLDMDKASAFTRGFVQETAGILSTEELSRLPLGIKVMTCELAMRFLTDYLDGDLYFKVNAPEHNLVRARAQMALLRDVEKREEELVEMAQCYVRQFSTAGP